MTNSEFYDKTIESLERQFPSKQSLNRHETAKALGIGVSTLDLRIKEGRNLPEYIKYRRCKELSYSIYPCCNHSVSSQF